LFEQLPLFRGPTFSDPVFLFDPFYIKLAISDCYETGFNFYKEKKEFFNSVISTPIKFKLIIKLSSADEFYIQ